MSQWQPISTAPKDGRTVDLWCGEYEERLTNYRRVKLSRTNVFYEPVYGGRACVRTATHWMEPPGPPTTQPEIQKGNADLVPEATSSVSVEYQDGSVVRLEVTG